jgi:hypothetical protein
LEVGTLVDYDSDTTDRDDVRTVSSVDTAYDWDHSVGASFYWHKRETREGGYIGLVNEDRPRRHSLRTDRWSSDRVPGCPICDFVVIKHFASHRCKACGDWARRTCGDACPHCTSWYCLTCYYNHPGCQDLEKPRSFSRDRAGGWAIDRTCAVRAARSGVSPTGEPKEAMLRYYRRRAYVVDAGKGYDWSNSNACPSCYRFVTFAERNPGVAVEAVHPGFPDPIKRCGFSFMVTHQRNCCSPCRYCRVEMCYPCLTRHYCAWSVRALQASYDHPFHMVTNGILLMFCADVRSRWSTLGGSGAEFKTSSYVRVLRSFLLRVTRSMTTS